MRRRTFPLSEAAKEVSLPTDAVWFSSQGLQVGDHVLTRHSAPLMSPGLGATTLSALAALAETVGFGAVFGTLFVPCSKAVTSSGALPGRPTETFEYNRDEGLLRVLDADGTVVAAGQRDGAGVFYNEASGVAFARAVSGSLIFDAAALDRARDEDAGAIPGIDARADLEDQPKLCPDPTADNPESASASNPAKQYQEQISRMINQRVLPFGLAMMLADPQTGRPVLYDDCADIDGTMMETKGPGSEYLVGREPMRDGISDDWLAQGTRQVDAAGGRHVEWYFAERGAADYAAKLFGSVAKLREGITVHFVRAQ